MIAHRSRTKYNYPAKLKPIPDKVVDNIRSNIMKLERMISTVNSYRKRHPEYFNVNNPQFKTGDKTKHGAFYSQHRLEALQRQLSNEKHLFTVITEYREQTRGEKDAESGTQS